MKSGLTPKQQDLLQFIERHIRRYGYAPSLHEMVEKTGKSLTAVHSLVNGLHRRGAISRTKYQPRSIKVL